MSKRLANGRSSRWAFMEKFIVPDYDTEDSDEDYLVRWRIIQSPWFGIYLHKLGTRDPRTIFHDHPWAFLSIVLKGGYVECVPGGTTVGYPPRRRHIKHINRKRSTDFHWIESLDRTPTWTLLFVGPRVREWGYLDPDGTWTRFDLHRNAADFDAALQRRNGRTT